MESKGSDCKTRAVPKSKAKKKSNTEPDGPEKRPSKESQGSAKSDKSGAISKSPSPTSSKAKSTKSRSPSPTGSKGKSAKSRSPSPTGKANTKSRPSRKAKSKSPSPSGSESSKSTPKEKATRKSPSPPKDKSKSGSPTPKGKAKAKSPTPFKENTPEIIGLSLTPSTDKVKSKSSVNSKVDDDKLSVNTGVSSTPSAKPKKTASTSSTKKQLEFISEPMGEKPITKLPGIGDIYGNKLKDKGITKMYHLLGKFLLLNKKKESFLDYLEQNCGATDEHGVVIYNCLDDWCKQHM